MMLFRKWRAKIREKIVLQWYAELTSLSPPVVQKLNVDEAKLEHWQKKQAALHPPGEPTTALDCDADSIEEKVGALLAWQRRTALFLKTVLESHTDSIHYLEGQRIRGEMQTFVTQAFLDSLIYTHPRPDLLKRHWHNQMPELIVEVTMDLPPDLAERHKEETLGWQAMVKHYTKLIDHAAAYYEKRRDEDDDD